MVTRKNSIPYPTSPPPPPPIQASHHDVNSSDIPAIPQSATRSDAPSSYEEMGNPWSDDFEPRQQKSDHSTGYRVSTLPETLKPGNGRTPSPNREAKGLPDALRVGRSGEITPRSSMDSDRSPEREWWDDDDEEEKNKSSVQHDTSSNSQGLHVVNDTSSRPSSSGVKRKPVPFAPPAPEIIPQSTGLSSNNPFRRPSETFLQPSDDQPNWGEDRKDKTPDRHPHPLKSSPSMDRLGMLSLNDNPSDGKIVIPPPIPSFAPPPPPAQIPTYMPHLQAPLQPQKTSDSNPWADQKISPQPSPIPFPTSQKHNTISSDNLLDRGHHEGSLPLREELKALPNAVPSPRPSMGEVSLLDDEGPPPTKPPRPERAESEELYAPPAGPPPSQIPPMKPPRPAVVTSDADLAKIQEQRNETYQIKHFSWFDLRTSRMRRSSMLVQNKNGPCPLLALVNAMILGATEDMQAALDDALRLREQVSLGLIIETLMDELITKASSVPDLELPEIDELNKFLIRLRTGMNANPRFVPSKPDAPNLMDADTPTTPTAPHHRPIAGTFESTPDIKLYSSFSVQLLHGWLPQPNDSAAEAFARSAPTYEDAQAVQFGEEELEYKLSQGGLTEQEQQLWQDITSIKQFFQTYPTQLTPYGLNMIKEALHPGEFSILFRNDHFSTIYKHPRDHSLYTLTTDAGYADRDEIIWESLEDIRGARTEYFSGDFQSVSHGDSAHPIPHSSTSAANPRRSSTQQSYLTAHEDRDAILTPQEQQEQHDADFAMALQLQEEEEQRQRQRQNLSGGQSGTGSGNASGIRASPPTRPARRSGQGIPIPLRSNPGGEQRPIIPPRAQRQERPAVNRPADAESADAPPAYEEAARLAAYNPPIGNPLHPSHNDLPSTNTGQATGQTSGVTRPQGRTSAYGDNTDQWGNSPVYNAGGYNHAYLGQGRRSEREGQRDRDCVVM